LSDCPLARSVDRHTRCTDDHRLPRRIARPGFIEGQNLIIVRDIFRSATSGSPTAGQRRTRRDNERRRCHHARPPEGNLDNSHYGRAKDRGFAEAPGAPAPESGHL
jgi:hypothetical protein